MKKNQIYVSPVGIAKYLDIAKPNTKFDEEGVYSVDLVLDEATAESFREKLEGYREEAVKELMADPANAKRLAKLQKFALHDNIKPEEDKDGNETGNFVIKFKTSASFIGRDKQKVDVKISVVDAKKQKFQAIDKIGRGSKVRVSFRLFAFANDSAKSIGISLRLSAVQLIELVEFGSSGADAFDEIEGFDGEEAGFADAVAGDAGTDEKGGDF